MTTILVPLLNGIVLAGAFVLLVRTVGRKYTVPLHAALLLSAPLFYVAFAARAGSESGLLVELVGTVVFGGVALAGLRRRSASLLALGWALHPVWDIALHTWGTGEAYTPEGYVVACFGFDLLLAALIARGWAGIVRAESAEAERFWIAYAPENHASGAGIRKAGFHTVADLSFDSAGRPALREKVPGRATGGALYRAEAERTVHGAGDRTRPTIAA